MMKVLLFSVLAALSVASISALECKTAIDLPTQWINMRDDCVGAMKAQVQREINAAIQYMAMGAYFSQDTVNRPGFAEMFFKSASEERQHGIALINYLLMRGELTQDLQQVIPKHFIPSKTTWEGGIEAMTDALDLEVQVTANITALIKTCENSQDFNDYHLVDYLTGEFLEEQYKGQRELAGRISTLKKMKKKHGILGEFLYDKELLS